MALDWTARTPFGTPATVRRHPFTRLTTLRGAGHSEFLHVACGCSLSFRKPVGDRRRPTGGTTHSCDTNREGLTRKPLWRTLTRPEGILDQLCSTPDDLLRERYRMRGWTAKIAMSANSFGLLRAVLLLLGDSGVRREEALAALRNVRKTPPGRSWPVGIGCAWQTNKRRTVFLPERAIERYAHIGRTVGWTFDFGMTAIPLVSPIVIPPTAASQKKHTHADGHRVEAGFTPDGLGQLISASLLRIADDEKVDLNLDFRDILRRSELYHVQAHFWNDGGGE